MTDLASLLHDESIRLEVPPAPTTEVLRQGRSIRRRRRLGAAGACVAVASAFALTVALTGVGGWDRERALDPAIAPTADDWAIAQGGRIHLGSGATVDVPGQVKTIYYTSAGMLVRVGATPNTDAPDSNYWLARDDGSVTDFDLSLGDRVPGTDPSLPYMAYAEPGANDAEWNVVLRDVRTGEVATTIAIEGRFTWGGWVAPPVALSGDHVYVGVDGTLLDVHWRTGEVIVTDIPTHMPEVDGGRGVVEDNSAKEASVVDMATGRSLMTLPYDASKEPFDAVWPRLSVDGSHVLLTPNAMCEDDGRCAFDDPTATVIDIETGQRRQLELSYGEYGWTATGELITLDGNTARICNLGSTECRTTTLSIANDAPVRVSGNSYES